MKKLFSLVLVLVLVFALAVPSFAYPHSDTEMEALNEIEYWTYWIHQDFTGYFNDIDTWFSTLVSRSESSLSNLLDINEYLRSVNSEITSLNDNLFGNFTFIEPFVISISDSISGLQDSFNFFNDSFFDNVLWGEPFAEVVQDNLTAMADDLNQLREVLADEQDLYIRNRQESNFSTVSSLFLAGQSNPYSLNSSDFSTVTSLPQTLFSLFSMPGSGSSSKGAISSGFQYLNYFTNGTYNLATWFEPSTRESLVTVPMTYSRDRSQAVVTHYYQDTLEVLYPILGGDDFGQ